MDHWGRPTCKIRKKELLLSTGRFGSLSPASFLWNKCLLKHCSAFLSLHSHDTAPPPFLPVLSAKALIPCSVCYPWPGCLSSSGFVFVMRDKIVLSLIRGAPVLLHATSCNAGDLLLCVGIIHSPSLTSPELTASCSFF